MGLGAGRRLPIAALGGRGERQRPASYPNKRAAVKKFSSLAFRRAVQSLLTGVERRGVSFMVLKLLDNVEAGRCGRGEHASTVVFVHEFKDLNGGGDRSTP